MTKTATGARKTGSVQRQVDFLLLGGGLASATAAETLRSEKPTGSILILSEEDLAPYHRPALSKQMLLGTADASRLLIHPESFYRDKAIDLQLGTRVVAVDPAAHTVTTATSEHIGYGRLLIATGTTPRSLIVPGAELAGVHTLRRLVDAVAVRDVATGAKRAVVLGGSFLGMEIAMSLIDLGLDVTIIELGTALLPHLEAPRLSTYFERYAASRGASVLLNDSIVAFHGRDLVEEVETGCRATSP